MVVYVHGFCLDVCLLLVCLVWCCLWFVCWPYSVFGWFWLLLLFGVLIAGCVVDGLFRLCCGLVAVELGLVLVLIVVVGLCGGSCYFGGSCWLICGGLVVGVCVFCCIVLLSSWAVWGGDLLPVGWRFIVGWMMVRWVLGGCWFSLLVFREGRFGGYTVSLECCGCGSLLL